jgi:manganese transport protein
MLMLLVKFSAFGGMYGGVAQALSLIVPGVPPRVWILIEMALTLFILLGGHYERIERIATIKVCLFTLLTLLSAVLLVAQPSFSIRELAAGFRFELPGRGLIAAAAVFGITGVGASELFMCSYWCTEKGYARFAGRNDGTTRWRERARGWVRVMQADVGASLLIYTTATVAFYLFGAGVLHRQGLVQSIRLLD